VKRVLLGSLALAMLLLLSIQPALAAPPVQGTFVHIVQWGETLSGIAVRYGATVGALAYANGIGNANRIYAGQRLLIPGATPYYAPSGRVYVVRYGDTLSGIAYRYGVSVNSLVRANGITNRNRIYGGQRLVIPYGAPAGPYHGRYHTVRYGQTLSGIAWRYGVSMWAIASANHLANPNVIYTGQRLYIP
jgi:LysM repeat protein